jgi:short-subunit dehydrogenase
MNRLYIEVRNVKDEGGYTSKSFKSFARKFKNSIAKELAKKNCTITAFNVGHYYLSGFFRNANDRCFYFSISDVRHFDFGNMLYRTAKHEKDYTGGSNQYVRIDNDMVYQMQTNQN